MKLGIFMMPVHPLHRDPVETLREDRETVILADKLGYHDAFIGEHLTDKAENITNSLLFLATLIHSTKKIKLGTGTCNLSQQHPTRPQSGSSAPIRDTADRHAGHELSRWRRSICGVSAPPERGPRTRHHGPPHRSVAGTPGPPRPR